MSCAGLRGENGTDNGSFKANLITIMPRMLLADEEQSSEDDNLGVD